MTKKTFLKKLETKLSNLSEKKRNDIIKKYENIIDKEVEAGKAEKEVIISFGDIDMIARLYIEDETCEKKEETSHTTGASIGNAIDSLLQFIDDSFKKIDDQLAKRILIILCFVFVGILGLSLLHIPFRIIDVLGTGIFSVIFDNYSFYNFVSSMWSFSISICYVVLVVWLIIHYVNKIVERYANKPKHTYTSEKVKVEEERKVEERVQVKETSPFDIIYIILKVFIIILTIPLLMVILGLVIALFFVISLIVSGVSLYGPAIFLIGVISLIGTLLDLVYTSLSKGGLK